MLKVKFLSAFVLAALSMYGQEFQKIPYVKAGTELTPIKKESAKVTTKAKGFGFGGATSSFEIPGLTSELIIAANSTFLISLPDGIDPTVWYLIYKTEIKNGNRFALMVNVKNVTGSKIDYGKAQIEYNVKKIKDGVFELVPGKLEPGEYAIVTSTKNPKEYDAFTFSVK